MKSLVGRWLLLPLLIIVFHSAYALEENKDTDNQLLTLNKELIEISANVYQHSAHKAPTQCQNIKTVDQLAKVILAFSDDSFLGIICIRANTALVYKNIDHKSVSDIAWYLYKNNAEKIADDLLLYSIDNFSDYTSAKIQYHKAKYYFLNERWKDVITLLKKTDIELALNQAEADYAYFIIAVALQNIQQHRDAIKVYKSISPQSDYYSVAQMNIAVANLLQGWWTDAHLILEQAIKKESKQKNYEVVDRMTLMLGFSQIQNEFYRDARESFRTIGIDSPYANRAMQGIGLSAMHQKDFTSALNAFTLLGNKKNIDSYVVQAYLLVPFAHEKLKQRRIAEAKYTQAAMYYRQKIALLDQAATKQSNLYTPDVITAISHVTQESDDQKSVISLLKLTNNKPHQRIEAKLRHVDKLQQDSTSKAVQSQLKKLHLQYKKIQKTIQRREIVNARAVYQSYLNQCQYALARLYDEN